MAELKFLAELLLYKCSCFPSALSQEEQDDSQLKVEDIVQMVSVTAALKSLWFVCIDVIYSSSII